MLNFCTVFPMLDHCQYCNTISKGEFHALKDQGIIGAGIILLKFTYEFCSVSVYLQLLGSWIHSLLTSLAQGDGTDLEFWLTYLIPNCCVSVDDFCPIFHALCFICCLLSPLLNGDIVRLTCLWLNCLDACPIKVIITTQFVIFALSF